ncbi:hypothetical protein HYV31_02875 [candidate division WWE3 bacterium]|nr:hypothetical protein [candidate division WWE3 bacterium]
MKPFTEFFYTILNFLGINRHVFAGVDDCGGMGQPACPTPPALDFKDLLTTIYGIVFPAIVIIGMIKVVVAGYTIMTSAGDPKSVQGAREDLTAAIMGLIFVLGAIGILRILVGSIITGGDPGF